MTYSWPVYRPFSDSVTHVEARTIEATALLTRPSAHAKYRLFTVHMKQFRPFVTGQVALLFVPVRMDFFS